MKGTQSGKCIFIYTSQLCSKLKGKFNRRHTIHNNTTCFHSILSKKCFLAHQLILTKYCEVRSIPILKHGKLSLD